MQCAWAHEYVSTLWIIALDDATLYFIYEITGNQTRNDIVLTFSLRSCNVFLMPNPDSQLKTPSRESMKIANWNCFVFLLVVVVANTHTQMHVQFNKFNATDD